MKGYINANTKIKCNNPVNPEITDITEVNNYINKNIANIINEKAYEIFPKTNVNDEIVNIIVDNNRFDDDGQIGILNTGEAVYQKTFIGVCSDIETIIIPENLNINRIIEISGGVSNKQGSITLPFGYISLGSGSRVLVNTDIDPNDGIYVTNNYYNTYNYYMVHIVYTEDN